MSGSNMFPQGVVDFRPTAPYPPSYLEEKSYYYSTASVCKMFRPDGVPITFLNHIHECDNGYNKEYLDAEIKNGNQMIRAATESEIHDFLFRRDPTGFTRQKVEEELTANLEALIEKKIAERGYILPDKESANPLPLMEPQAIGEIHPDLSGTAVDAQKIAGVDKPTTAAQRLANAVLTPMSSAALPQKAG